MKRLSTTPVIKTKQIVKQISLITIAAILVATMPFQIAQIVKADDFDERIAKIQAEIDGYQAEAAKLNGQADSLQKEVNALNAQKNVIQSQINLKQAEYDQLVQKYC